MQAESYKEKEEWIGKIGRAMLKESVMMEDFDEDAYM